MNKEIKVAIDAKGVNSPYPLSVEIISAMGAHGTRPIGSAGVEVQDHLPASVKTRLTQVMQRLVCTWYNGGQLCITDFQAIRELANTDLEKRVSAALVHSLLHISQFITCVGILAVKIEKGGVVSEERVLNFEQFAVHLRELTRHLIPVAQLDSGSADVLCEAQGTNGGPNK